jgi:ABC-2 type transport system ATP-binding protein
MVSVGESAEDRPLLIAENVARSYGRIVALAPTTLEVRGGDLLALIGPNGAGKSTLLSILAGALAATDGRVRVGNADHRGPPKVGWVPQRPAHYARLSARENLELFARLEQVTEPERAAERLLRLVELPNDDRPAAELSAGNQQRLNLAIALLAQPDVLLLDEPTASLDPRQRRRFWEVASRVPEQGGAVVFATQNLEELERVANRVAVLLEGRLVFDGTVDQFAQAPQADVFA